MVILAVPGWAGEWKLSVQPERIAQGGVLFVELQGGSGLQQPSCDWLSHTYPLYAAVGGYRAALPVHRLHKIGPAMLVVRAGGHEGPLAERTLTIVRLDTGPIEIVRLTPETMALQKDPRLEEDSKRLRQIIQTRTPEQLWKGNFQPPTTQPGHNFGKERRYVEVRRKGRRPDPGFVGYHRGLDFALAPGTPVPAANAGKVLAAEPFVLTGNVVLLDHGQGLLTAYMHLSEFRVKPGDTVARGDIIGLTGNTGRSTGPHLHWSVYVQGDAVNPVAITKLPELFTK